jgi:hypothetical protein
MAFNLDTHVNNAMSAVVGAVGISIAFGIGLYILTKLNEASGNQIQTAVDMFSNTQSIFSAVVTFLAVGAIAGIGIGLVSYLRSIRTRGE